MGLELRELDGSVEGQARDLYHSAFPEEERIPFERLVSMSSLPGCSFLWISVDGRFSGIAYVVESDSLMFLLYLAVCPGERNAGLGSDTIWMLKCRCGGRRMFLNIEPTDEPSENMGQRLRRTRFYERNGFEPQGAYRTPDGMRYVLLSWGGPVSFEEAFELYSERMPSERGDGLFHPSGHVLSRRCPTRVAGVEA